MGAVLAVVENEEEFEWIQDQLQDIYRKNARNINPLCADDE